jgi:hypothetical protein
LLGGDLETNSGPEFRLGGIMISVPKTIFLAVLLVFGFLSKK